MWQCGSLSVAEAAACCMVAPHFPPTGWVWVGTCKPGYSARWRLVALSPAAPAELEARAAGRLNERPSIELGGRLRDGSWAPSSCGFP